MRECGIRWLFLVKQNRYLETSLGKIELRMRRAKGWVMGAFSHTPATDTSPSVRPRTGTDTGSTENTSAGFGLANPFAREFMFCLMELEQHFKPSNLARTRPPKFCSPTSSLPRLSRHRRLRLPSTADFAPHCIFLRSSALREDQPSLPQFHPRSP